eukprot:3421976-Prymnesium_polylepis.1
MKDELARTKSKAEEDHKAKIAADKESKVRADMVVNLNTENARLLAENASQKTALDATKKTLDET